MTGRKHLPLAVLFVLVALAASACDQLFPPPSLNLEAVPVYTGAEHIDATQNSVVAAVYRQDRKAIASGHKSESIAYVLPMGTTSSQVRQFYVSRLPPLGGSVEDQLGNNAPLGSIYLHRGPQDIEVEFDAMSESPAPILLIQSFVVNGCTRPGANCKAGPELVRASPPGLELQNIPVTRSNFGNSGTITTDSYYCVGPGGTRVAPADAFATPTPP